MEVNSVSSVNVKDPSFCESQKIKKEYISPKTSIIYDIKPDKFVKNNKAKITEKTKKELFKFVGLTTALAAVVFRKRIAFSVRNLGKKGVQNFLNGSADQKLKDVIGEVSKNSEIKSILDKMSVANIKIIARHALPDGVVDLMTGKAIMVIGEADAPHTVKHLIDFSNKKGYAFLKEVRKANEHTRAFNVMSCEKAVHVIKDKIMIKPQLYKDMPPGRYRQAFIVDPGRTSADFHYIYNECFKCADGSPVKGMAFEISHKAKLPIVCELLYNKLGIKCAIKKAQQMIVFDRPVK